MPVSSRRLRLFPSRVRTSHARGKGREMIGPVALQGKRPESAVLKSCWLQVGRVVNTWLRVIFREKIRKRTFSWHHICRNWKRLTSDGARCSPDGGGLADRGQDQPPLFSSQRPSRCAVNHPPSLPPHLGCCWLPRSLRSPRRLFRHRVWLATNLHSFNKHWLPLRFPALL